MSFRSSAEKWKDEAIRIRRHIHQNPELGHQEFETAKLVAQFLEDVGLEVQTGVGGTGVVGLLKGGHEGRTIGIRADMDALPIVEKTGLPFASVREGVMHACGHDVHTAILLGTAAALSEHRDELLGTVKFIFQPAEEVQGGATDLIAAGVLHNPEVNAIIALHVWPDLPAGKIGLRKGAMLAAADAFDIRVTGKGGHAAYPHRTIDPVIIAAQIITALQTVVSRNLSPLDSSVISITKLQSNSNAYNVIAGEVQLRGTIRTHNPETREAVPVYMKRLIETIAEGFGGKAEFDYYRGGSPVINDDHIVDVIEQAAADTVGQEAVVYLKEPSMGAEDFGAYLEYVPGAIFRLGTITEEDARSVLPLHSDSIIFDEQAIVTGISVLGEAAIRYLNHSSDDESRIALGVAAGNEESGDRHD
ncbi:M20 metallopeptidase family protein [Paenibacillus sp. AD87]|uniref:M20 metallopeptidase family protein n=1 Tax=Paenibacillus sp. AD87 TaxID=1528787 RepID=UPI0007E4176E|nr:amidohydrolase [Paenibacillus sp. AD87]OAX49071.1 putative hydrolase YxeP [Paenibacillus sp. AD87]